MRCLGLDLGSKTLGVATSDYTNTIATSLKTIFFEENNYPSLIEPIRELITEYNITTIVLGLPKNMNNTLGDRAEISLKFKEMLENSFNNIKVILEDERLTTVISNNIMIKADISRKKRKKKVDSIAAQLILQSYLDRKGE